MKPFNTFAFAVAATFVMTSAASAQHTININGDSTRVSPRTQRAVNQFSKDFGIYIGLNNWNAGPGGELSNFGSRYVALSWRRNVVLSRGRSAKLRMGIGPEIAWNNFMLQGDQKFVEAGDRLVVIDEGRNLRRSKLTVAQVNLPVVFNVSFRSGITVGLGAYAGVRLDSYTKVKPEGGKAERDHDNFGINTFRFGLTTELGWNDKVQFFVRYEPTPLFTNIPNSNVWALGFRL